MSELHFAESIAGMQFCPFALASSAVSTRDTEIKWTQEKNWLHLLLTSTTGDLNNLLESLERKAGAVVRLAHVVKI